MKWSGHHPVRGVVQIAHGLGDHMGRYAKLAETLVHGEFVVYGNDHRANVAVQHRGWWFYVDDTDLTTKRIFQRIQMLFLTPSIRGDPGNTDRS